MRIGFAVIGLAAALASGSAAAQISVGGGVNVGVGAGTAVNTGGITDRVTGTLDGTVNRLDHTTNSAVNSGLALATSADVRSGVVVRDENGRRIGVVQSVDGDTAIVVRRNRQFHMPLSSLYRSGSGLVTSLSRSQIQTSAQADARAEAHASHR